MDNIEVFWLVALVVLVAIEIITVGLTTIWFAAGALVAEVVALLDGPLWLQVLLFVAVSVILLLFTRPLAMKYINNSRTKTNVDSLIGKKAVVLKTIDNVKGSGQASFQGIEWTARSFKDDVTIQPGEIVNIEAVDGVKLMVSPTGEREEV